MVLLGFPTTSPEYHLPLSHSTRDYQVLQFPSGLQCFLISDPSSHLVSAAIAVQSGQFNDPPDVPGLAHLCEHLIFGAKTAGLHSEVARAGGIANAYTSSTQTCFGFEISTFAQEKCGGVEIPAVDAALEKFLGLCSLGKLPLDVITREIRSVNDEHIGNTANCDKVLWHGLRILSSDFHPFHRFSTGNMATLTGLSLRSLKTKARAYYSKYFTPDQMVLVLKGPQSSNHLKKLAIAHFSSLSSSSSLSRNLFKVSKQTSLANQMPNNKVPESKTKNSTLPDLFQDLEPNVLYIKAEFEPRLRLCFPMNFGVYSIAGPVQRQLCNLLGCELPGSWCYFLKNKSQYLQSVLVSVEQVSSAQQILVCDLEMTKKGMRNIQEIISLFFFFVEERIMATPEKDLRSLLDNFGRIEENRFRRCRPLHSSLDEVFEYACRFKTESAVANKNFIRGYEPWGSASQSQGCKNVRQALRQALTRTKMKVQILSETFMYKNSFSEESLTLVPEKDEFYGFEYLKFQHFFEKAVSLPASFEIITYFEPFSHPEPLAAVQNNFLYGKIKHRDIKIASEVPVLIVNENNTKVWIQSTPHETQVYASVSIKFSNVSASTENLSGIEILTAMLGESLEYKLYYMELVGSDWGFFPNVNGEPSILFTYRGEGYSLPNALKEILGELKSLLNNVGTYLYEKLKRARVFLRRLFKSHIESQGIAQMEVMIHLLLEGGFVPIEDRVEALELMDIETLSRLASKLLSGPIVTSTFISEGVEGVDINQIKNVCSFLTNENCDSGLRNGAPTSKILPPGAHFVFDMQGIADDPSSVVYYYIQMGSRLDNTLFSVSKLLQFLLSSTSFESLRTRRELCYSIFRGMKLFRNTFGVFLCVPAIQKDCMMIVEQIEEYLTDLEIELLGYTQKEWESLISRFLSSLETGEENEFPSSLFSALLPLVSSSNFDTSGDEFKGHWNNLFQILNETYDFGGQKCEEPINEDLLKRMSHQTFCKFFRNRVSVNSTQRSILIVTKPNGPVSLELRISEIAGSYSRVLSQAGLDLSNEQIKSCLRKCEDKENFSDLSKQLRGLLTSPGQQVKFHKFLMYHKLVEILAPKPQKMLSSPRHTIRSKEHFTQVKEVRQRCLVSQIEDFLERMETCWRPEQVDDLLDFYSEALTP